jgi:hypothetical protein
MQLPTFSAIDDAKRSLGLSDYALCQEAGVHCSTYYRLKKNPEMNAGVATFRRLWAAIERLRRGRASEDVPRPILAQAFKSYLVAAAMAEGLSLEDVLVFDPHENRPRDPAWLRISRVRQAAIYLTVTEHNVAGGRLADAVGVSKQAISKSLGAVEDRRDDPAWDALLDRIPQLMKGRAA